MDKQTSYQENANVKANYSAFSDCTPKVLFEIIASQFLDQMKQILGNILTYHTRAKVCTMSFFYRCVSHFTTEPPY